MRLGILTSGGDAPGMNAVIAGAADRAAASYSELEGFEYGFAGLLEGRRVAIDLATAMQSRTSAGTLLGTGRSAALTESRGIETAVERFADHRIDGLIVIGGNGTLAAARQLAGAGQLVAFVPATIDDDIPLTTTIGFDSAVEYGCAALERLRITSRSLPGRGFVLQVLGGDTGHLARAIAARTGMRIVLTPDQEIDLDQVAGQLAEHAAVGDAIAVLSEGAGDAVRLSESLAGLAGIRVHPTILGHTQRAATPTAFDVHAGLEAGRCALEELLAGRSTFVAVSHPGEKGGVAVAATPLRLDSVPAEAAQTRRQ